MWETLSPPWRACLEEAWQAYCGGTIPIGAVVADGKGTILSRGRNRIFDAGAPAGQVCQTELAHAELNALLSLGVDEGNRRSWILYTTTEPCPLCLGAFYMSGIRTLHYASRDPWAGSVNLLGATPYLGRKPIKIVGPDSTGLEMIIIALFVEWELYTWRERPSIVREKMREIVSPGVILGEQLYKSGLLRQMRTDKLPASEVISRLGEML